jgi:hypothetical protein
MFGFINFYIKEYCNIYKRLRFLDGDAHEDPMNFFCIFVNFMQISKDFISWSYFWHLKEFKK